MDNHPVTSTPRTSRLDQDLQETVEAQGSQQVEGPLVAHPQEVTLPGRACAQGQLGRNSPRLQTLPHPRDNRTPHSRVPESPDVLELVSAQMENGKVARTRQHSGGYSAQWR